MRRALGALLLSIGVLVTGAGRASASCAAAPALEEGIRRAGVVFVGTVVSTANVDRFAVVAVEEVWKGPSLPAQVEVRGTSVPDGADMFTSVDRSFQAGVRYLFVLADGTGPPFADNNCSLTQEWRPELAAYRPGVAPPTSVAPATTVPAATVAPTTTTAPPAPATTAGTASTVPALATTTTAAGRDIALAGSDADADGDAWPWAWAVAGAGILVAASALVAVRLRR